MNGSAKPYMNGGLSKNPVHIRENPQVSNLVIKLILEPMTTNLEAKFDPQQRNDCSSIFEISFRSSRSYYSRKLHRNLM